MKLGKVYHSSREQGLKKLIPQKSTHGVEWVYGTKDLVMSAVFLNSYGGDFTCSVGREEETGKVYICERFKGAFDLRYEGIQGSIYVLSQDNFLDGKTSWNEEVVCPVPVEIIGEIKIEDAREFLISLEEQEKLIVKYYPEKIDGIPSDDEDLVMRGIIWTRRFGDEILERVKLFHPHLLERILQGLKEDKYIDF